MRPSRWPRLGRVDPDAKQAYLACSLAGGVAAQALTAGTSGTAGLVAALYNVTNLLLRSSGR